MKSRRICKRAAAIRLNGAIAMHSWMSDGPGTDVDIKNAGLCCCYIYLLALMEVKTRWCGNGKQFDIDFFVARAGVSSKESKSADKLI